MSAATYHVSQLSPQASDAAPGTAERPWKTISQAAEAMQRVFQHTAFAEVLALVPQDDRSPAVGEFKDHHRAARRDQTYRVWTGRFMPEQPRVLTP